MKLSLSVRVVEKFHTKREPSMALEGLADLAVAHGYPALCMRASQVGVHTPLEEVEEKHRRLGARGLEVSMVTGDFAIPENSDAAPAALRHITPHLDLAAALGADLLRLGMKQEEDIAWAQRAADEAQERGMRLAHQCHTCGLFERVQDSLEVLRRINRENFGLIYEPANLELCGQDYGPETIRLFAPYLFNVYLQNQQLKPDGQSAISTWCRGEVRFDQIPLWEEGGIDFPLVLGTLEEIGYRGYVTIHQAFGGLRGPREAVEQSARYLRSLARFR